MANQADRLWTSPYTDGGDDGRQHEVTDEAFHAARELGVPVVAVCGHEVQWSPATTEPGRACRLCLLIVRRSREERRDVQQLVQVPVQRGRAPQHRRARELRRSLFHLRSEHARRASR